MEDIIAISIFAALLLFFPVSMLMRGLIQNNRKLMSDGAIFSMFSVCFVVGFSVGFFYNPEQFFLTLSNWLGLTSNMAISTVHIILSIFGALVGLIVGVIFAMLARKWISI